MLWQRPILTTARPQALTIAMPQPRTKRMTQRMCSLVVLREQRLERVLSGIQVAQLIQRLSVTSFSFSMHVGVEPEGRNISAIDMRGPQGTMLGLCIIVPSFLPFSCAAVDVGAGQQNIGLMRRSGEQGMLGMLDRRLMVRRRLIIGEYNSVLR